MAEIIYSRQSLLFLYRLRRDAASLSLTALCVVLMCSLCSSWAAAGERALAHGLWVWKGPSVLQAPGGSKRLRDFCQSAGINEVYISVSEHGDMSGLERFAEPIDLLHRSHVRVEALLSSVDADEPGKHWDKLLDHVRAVVKFNRDHPRNGFDGIHLDIEPQQRPENKGAGNLRFLPNLVAAYRDVRGLAEPVHLTVNADIQNKLLKGNASERKMLLSSLPHFTLMMYELSSPNDGKSTDEKAEKVRTASKQFLDMAYEGLREEDLGTMIIGLRTPDYEQLLPKMLETLDEANTRNPHYRGWARHDYGDTLKAGR